MTDINWGIANMERRSSDGAVYTVHWTASIEQNGEVAGSYGSIGFGDPDPTSFIKFDRLTQDKVLSWVKDAMGEEQIASLEKNLKDQIQAKLKPTSISGIPW